LKKVSEQVTVHLMVYVDDGVKMGDGNAIEKATLDFG